MTTFLDHKNTFYPTLPCTFQLHFLPNISRFTLRLTAPGGWGMPLIPALGDTEADAVSSVAGQVSRTTETFSQKVNYKYPLYVYLSTPI